MRSGKVKESVLIRSILRQLHKESSYGSPAPGEDAGAFLPDGMVTDSHGVTTTRTVEGRALAPERLVFGLVNAMTAAGPSVTTVTSVSSSFRSGVPFHTLIQRSLPPRLMISSILET